MIVFENKGVQVPSEDEEEVEEVDLSTSVTELSPRPGETGWEYSTEECPEELLVSYTILIHSLAELKSLSTILLDCFSNFMGSS